jgi:hypothetical protein
MPGDGRVYRCGPEIAWVKDMERTILVQEAEGRSWSLQGQEAMIWDLLTLGYSFERVVAFLSVSAADSVEETGGTLLALLQQWEQVGIVQIVELGSPSTSSASPGQGCGHG